MRIIPGGCTITDVTFKKIASHCTYVSDALEDILDGMVPVYKYNLNIPQ